MVQKPVPTAQQHNPRDFQIGQVVKRVSPQREDGEHGTTLTFKLKPTDPDFPFDLPGGLQCTLGVPVDYPQSGRPSLRVSNKTMPRGHQINVERGFDALIDKAPQKTLLAYLNDLDRHLEEFLISEKAQTIKISANAPATSTPVEVKPVQAVSSPVSSKPTPLPRPLYSSQQKAEALRKRETDVRQLEARMGRLPLYSKSSDGTIYNLPIQIPKPARLPVSLQAVKEVVLFVPPLYNLEPCTVHLKGIESRDSQNVEMAFEKHARQRSDMTLMAHVNQLAVNMHTMSIDVPPIDTSNTTEAEAAVEIPPAKSEEQGDGTIEQLLDADRPHVKVIPRPPEWDRPDGDSDESSSDYTSSEVSDESDDEDDGTIGGASLPTGAAAPVSDRGIAISFPDIELYGIELFEIAALGLSLKCDRCKTTIDMTSVKPSTTGTLTVTQICPKCSYEVSASFSRTPVHAHNVRAGHLDLTSCSVLDMLPSTFTPTCSSCSTPFPSPPGVTSVRGESTLTICRNCHAKMTFLIPSVKFLRLSNTHSSTPMQSRRKPPRENLGITTGTALPNTGRCPHYRKSLRWFRFSCCSKVFPCDKCHDEQVSPKHANEHANRMICGWCSREQNYRPEDCGVCGKELVGRKGGGFWEGGKGTRDPMRMSRKEPRKYKRVGAKNKAKENR